MQKIKINIVIIGLIFLSLTTYGEIRIDYLQNGKLHLTELDIENAINSFTKAIMKKQNVAEALLQRAQAYLINGECEKAAEDYTKAFKLDPEFVKKQLGISNSAPDYPAEFEFSKPDYYE